MSKEFDIVDIDEKKADKFAEALRNPTSKKIWQFLKKKQASQKDISEKLKIPLPTVHYSIERLIAAGLVEEADYYWSPKGNKVRIYRASKKVMVFTPYKTPLLEQHLRSILGIVVVFIAVLALVAFQHTLFSQTNEQDPIVDNAVNQNLQRFDTEQEFLDTIQKTRNNPVTFRENGGPAALGNTVDEGSTLPFASNAKTTEDYSTTNIQVAGVDEADIIKTDGEYLYIVSKGTLIIAQAHPAKDAEILSRTKLGDLYANELFMQGDRVAVLGSKIFRDTYQPEVGVFEEMAVGGLWYPSSGSQLALVDVADKKKPEVLRTLEFEGDYLTSRKVGSYIYFVINSYPHYEAMDSCEGVVPLYADVAGESVTKEDKQIIAPCTEIGYIDPVQTQSFVTVAAVSITDEDERLHKETILGNAAGVYASEKNIYVTQTVYPYNDFLPPPTPLLDVDVGGDIRLEEEQSVIAPENEEIASEKPSTVITRFSIKDGAITFSGKAEVLGTILNQFSMDEYDDTFRIATTTTTWTAAGDESESALYVFDDDLEQIGSLTGIAPGEHIYAARFMGERAYLITFKQVDPLFVIDLEDPRKPTILGKLKIPGFSNYLHPIDEDHLLGIGQEVEEIKKDQFVTTGVKIAIFDVSDVENPKEIHKEVLGSRHSSSLAQYNHRAVLYDAERELFVLPLLLTKKGDEEWYYPTTFTGVHVYKVTIKEGFDLQGTITHYTKEEEQKLGDYYYNYEILRSLYIENVLYTLSNSRLQLNDLKSLKKIKTLELHKETEQEEEPLPTTKPTGEIITGRVIAVETKSPKTENKEKEPEQEVLPIAIV